MAQEIAVDRLAGGAPVEVFLVDDLRVGEGPLRDPHRHDYHELLIVRSGSGEAHVDGEPVPVAPGTATVVGRGQVHQFRRADGVAGALVRFTDEALAASGERIPAAWLLTGRGGRTIVLGDAGCARAEALCALLADEVARPPDPYAAGVVAHLLTTLLLWLERAYDAGRQERREAEDADVQLHRRFTAQLEADFARHHAARHYADALGVPPAALSRTLGELTGATTKELVVARVMLEAARLLRFSDLTIGQVAHRVGFDDQLYFSRAFKRHHGEAPGAYRERVRGEVHASPG